MNEKEILNLIDEFNLSCYPGQLVKVKTDTSSGTVDCVLESAAWYDNKTKSPIVRVSNLGRINLLRILPPQKIRGVEREQLIKALIRGYREQEQAYLLTVKAVLTAEEYRYFEQCIGAIKHG